VKPENPIKTPNFNPFWGMGEFTCIHTLADEGGAWWEATLKEEVTITKVQILNRGDCCGRRLNGAKVYVDDTVCGTINDPP
jgi:hypothetical protein